MTRVYYKEAVGAIVVFDVTRISTYEAVKKWKSDIDVKVTFPGTQDPIPVVLLANYIDRATGKDGWGKTKEEMDKFCAEHGFVGWWESSTWDVVNIEAAAHELVKHIIQKVNQVHEENDPNTIKLDGGTKQKKKEEKCFMSESTEPPSFDSQLQLQHQ